MKQTTRLRWFCLILAALMLLNTAVFAEPTETDPIETDPVVTDPVVTDPIETDPIETDPIETDPIETDPIETDPIETDPVETEPEPEPEPPDPRTMTDEELIEYFQIPDSWARPALLFAVRTGLLTGRDNGLCPTDNTTRAEVATILMRVAGTTSKANISAYWDVQPGAWYYDTIAQAVALGLLNGTSDNTMSPDSFVTREQMFVILARFFGLNAAECSALYTFSDWRDISDWAAPSMAAMLQAGYISGDGQGLNPKGYITRQEMAQVLCNMLADFGPDLPDEYTGTFVLSAGTIPAGTVIEGDLVLCNEAGQITLQDVTVTGRLVIQGVGSVRLNLEQCDIHELVCCRNTVLYGDQMSPERVVCVARYVDLYGDFETVEVWNSMVNITKNSQAWTVNLMATGSWVGVNGTVGIVNALNKRQVVGGSGVVHQLNAYYPPSNVYCTVVNQTDYPNPMSLVTASALEPVIVTFATPSSHVTVRIANLPTPQREYTVEWLVNGTVLASESRVLLKNGQNLTATLDFTDILDENHPSNTGDYVLRLRSSNGDKAQFTFQADTSDTVVKAAYNVRTQNVQATVKRNTTIYSQYNLSGAVLGTLNKGTQVTYVTYSTKDDAIYSAFIRTKDGKTGWVDFADIQVSSAKYYVTWDYTPEVKEYWVNHIKNASSNKRYLIWISLYTQKVNIFEGSKGNWHLIHTFSCASGTNDHCTKVQDTTIKSKPGIWHYRDEGFYVDHVTLFDYEGRAFHSRLKKYGPDGELTDEIYSYAMGYPASHGCIRMMDDGVLFIWDNCPIGTAVIVY